MYFIDFMKRTSFKLLCLCFWFTGLAAAQAPLLATPSAAVEALPSVPSFEVLGGAIPVSIAIPPVDLVPVPLIAPAALPRMAPELALQVCRGRSVIQAEQLVSYSATTLIRAQLPDTAQSGEYE